MPTDAEWNTLESTLSAQGYNNIAKALCTKTNWIANTYDRAVGNDPGKNNASGFSALPAGCRSQTGEFMEQNYRAFWWTATESGDDPLDAILRQMHYISDRLGRTIYLKMNGFPVRLVRD